MDRNNSSDLILDYLDQDEGYMLISNIYHNKLMYPIMNDMNSSCSIDKLNRIKQYYYIRKWDIKMRRGQKIATYDCFIVISN